MNIQSADNWKGISETVRQLPGIEDSNFWNWFNLVVATKYMNIFSCRWWWEFWY